MNLQPHDPALGPLFSWAEDAQRIHKQLERIRDLMIDGRWRSVDELIAVLKYKYGGEYGSPSVQANLRHLRHTRFGGYTVCIRRRSGGLHEYLVHRPLCVCVWCAEERERKENRGKKAA